MLDLPHYIRFITIYTNTYIHFLKTCPNHNHLIPNPDTNLHPSLHPKNECFTLCRLVFCPHSVSHTHIHKPINHFLSIFLSSPFPDATQAQFHSEKQSVCSTGGRSRAEALSHCQRWSQSVTEQTAASRNTSLGLSFGRSSTHITAKKLIISFY